MRSHEASLVESVVSVSGSPAGSAAKGTYHSISGCWKVKVYTASSAPGPTGRPLASRVTGPSW